jgi:hypothetical protein
MKRTNPLSLLVLLAIYSLAMNANAADWIFQRSYYSHNPVQPVRIGPQPAANLPIYSAPQGYYYSSGLRQIRSTIQVGNSVDNYYEWEGWGQRGFQN